MLFCNMNRTFQKSELSHVGHKHNRNLVSGLILFLGFVCPEYELDVIDI
jgi:hypothetical protein